MFLSAISIGRWLRARYQSGLPPPLYGVYRRPPLAQQRHRRTMTAVDGVMQRRPPLAIAHPHLTLVRPQGLHEARRKAAAAEHLEGGLVRRLGDAQPLVLFEAPVKVVRHDVAGPRRRAAAAAARPSKKLQHPVVLVVVSPLSVFLWMRPSSEPVGSLAG